MARITHYDVGDYWQPQATFAVNGTATDPTALTVRLQNAAGTESVIADAVNPASLNASSTPVAKTATGVFKLNPGVQLDAAGYWYVRFEGTGAAAAAEEQQAIVDPSEFTSDGGVSSRALVGLAETKDWLQQQNITTTDDLEIVRVINDVSDRFHQEAGREFKVSGSNPQTRSFAVEPQGVTGGVVNIGDATSVTLVEIIDTDWVTVLETVGSADWRAWPLTRESWEPIRRLQFNHRNGVRWLHPGYVIRVTGSWGFPSVPGNVRQAVLDAVAATLDRDVEHYRQDLAPRSDQGGTILQVTQRPMFLSMPASALAVAWTYRYPTVG